MRFIKIPLMIIVFLLVVIFLVENHSVFSQTMVVRLDLLYGINWSSSEMPIYFYLAFCFLVGFVVCLLLLLSDRIKNARALRKAQKNVKALEQEINSLRTMALNTELESPEPASETLKPAEQQHD